MGVMMLIDNSEAVFYAYAEMMLIQYVYMEFSLKSIVYVNDCSHIVLSIVISESSLKSYRDTIPSQRIYFSQSLTNNIDYSFGC